MNDVWLKKENSMLTIDAVGAETLAIKGVTKYDEKKQKITKIVLDSDTVVW